MGFSTGGSSWGSKGQGPMSEINVTPLVDVMLVLLVIFMVAAPMMTTAVPVALPSARAERIEVEQDTPLLTVTRERKIYLGETEVAYDALESAIQRNASGIGDAVLRAVDMIGEMIQGAPGAPLPGEHAALLGQLGDKPSTVRAPAEDAREKIVTVHEPKTSA